MKLNLPSTWTRKKISALLLSTWLSANGIEAGQAFKNCLTLHNSTINAFSSLLKYPFANSSLINDGYVQVLCCNSNQCSPILYANQPKCPDDSLPFFCLNTTQDIFCGKDPCRGIAGNDLITTNVFLGNCSGYNVSSLSTVSDYIANAPVGNFIDTINNSTFNQLDKGYAHWFCPSGSPCYHLVGGCWWDNGGWTCSFISNDVNHSCVLQWPAPWPGPADKNPLIYSYPSVPTNTSSNNSYLVEKIAIPIGTVVGVVTVGGVTCLYRRYSHNKKEKYLQQLIKKVEEKLDEDSLKLLIGAKLGEGEVRKVSFFGNSLKSKGTWLNKYCALIISRKEFGSGDYHLWLVVYEPSFKKIKANVSLIRIAEKITPIEEEWEEIIKSFKNKLEKSEYPGADIYNNIYITELPPLIQDYKNVSKRKLKLSPNDNPDNYLRPYDIVRRKMAWTPAYHAAIYLGNGKVAHISRPEGANKKGEFGAEIDAWKIFLKGAKKIEIHHPFIPFKKPELIKRHINIAINAKYGEGKYNLLGNNCEHFATMCVYGLGVSLQSKRKLGEADYLLEAIKESNELFKKMENELIQKGRLGPENHSENQAESSGGNNNQQLKKEDYQKIDLDDYFEEKIEIPPKNN